MTPAVITFAVARTVDFFPTVLALVLTVTSIGGWRLWLIFAVASVGLSEPRFMLRYTRRSGNSTHTPDRYGQDCNAAQKQFL